MIPRRPRGGFLSIPREWIAAIERGEITVEQFGILAVVAAEANYAYATEVLAADGRRYGVGIGQTLLGCRKFAERYKLGKGGRDRVVRAIKRGATLGLCTRTPAAAPSPNPGGAPHGAPPSAPPPTLVSFKRDAAILFPSGEGAPPLAPPRAPRAAPGPDPIQPGNRTTTNTTSPAPSAARRARPSKERKDPDPRHGALVDRLTGIYTEVRGEPYGFLGGRDARAVSDLLRLSDGNSAVVETRWRRALSLGRYPGCATLSTLRDRWNEFTAARPGGAAGTSNPNAPQAPSQQFTSIFEDAR